MARTFNCGVGMIAIVAPSHVQQVSAQLNEAGETAFEIGRIEAGRRGCTVSGSAGTWSARGDWSATHHG